ncbi:Alpha/Beta hydrolase protein [Schizophyllum amplum]|uniref:Alpha/Beta hydrolase protein n=1 Tax=Schizophyllum amplum TaxID=97359 RepID=A0A550C8I8_9AGAR|nr:Alpha/Beta hydrolase protein [Auriculariopsis ampla]
MTGRMQRKISSVAGKLSRTGSKISLKSAPSSASLMSSKTAASNTTSSTNTSPSTSYKNPALDPMDEAQDKLDGELETDKKLDNVKASKVRSRWSLALEAKTWRRLMAIGMYMHTLAHPRPPGPNFTRKAKSTVSTTPGDIPLIFYTPPGYPNSPTQEEGYPVIVNFHGGGFTIGAATDDCRWAASCSQLVNAIVVSVEYRLAPEYPFPTGVEDGVDAIFYLVENAQELKINTQNIAVSGFSAGGNMAFTVPLRWQYELRARLGKPTHMEGNTELPMNAASRGTYDAQGRIATICAFYPSLDFTHTREERRATNTRPDKCLPKFFTELFDASYLHPPIDLDRRNPYLSPGVAPDEMLRGLPKDILMYTCEWDELLAEAKRFRERLESTPLDKDVRWRMVEGAPHAWDKSVNGNDPERDVIYEEACAQLRRIFYGSEQPLQSSQPRETTAQPSA